MNDVASGMSLYFGDVLHRRLAPALHAFRHGVFFLRLRIDGTPPVSFDEVIGRRSGPWRAPAPAPARRGA